MHPLGGHVEPPTQHPQQHHLSHNPLFLGQSRAQPSSFSAVVCSFLCWSISLHSPVDITWGVEGSTSASFVALRCSGGSHVWSTFIQVVQDYVLTRSYLGFNSPESHDYGTPGWCPRGSSRRGQFVADLKQILLFCFMYIYIHIYISVD